MPSNDSDFVTSRNVHENRHLCRFFIYGNIFIVPEENLLGNLPSQSDDIIPANLASIEFDVRQTVSGNEYVTMYTDVQRHEILYVPRRNHLP